MCDCGLQSQRPGTLVTTMEVDSDNTVLISADYLGFIYLWNIVGYCLNGAETHSPQRTCSGRTNLFLIFCTYELFLSNLL